MDYGLHIDILELSVTNLTPRGAIVEIVQITYSRQNEMSCDGVKPLST